MTNKKRGLFSQLSGEELSYIAGFLDGDGSIVVQIVKDKTRKYNFCVRVYVCFFQKSKRNWFLLQMKDKLTRVGTIRDRKDGVSEYAIRGQEPVRQLLEVLYPYLKIKKVIAKLALRIIEEGRRVGSREDFLKVCKMVDKVALHTDSKKRTITSSVVENSEEFSSILRVNL